MLFVGIFQSLDSVRHSLFLIYQNTQSDCWPVLEFAGALTLPSPGRSGLYPSHFPGLAGIIAQMSSADEVDAESIKAADIQVLIVDNEAAHAHTVAESLERVGFQCSVATSGTEGAKLIAN